MTAGRIAYIDCFSGASGDMLLGALIDAALSLSQLQEDLATLGLADVELTAERVLQHGISGTQFDVHDRSNERPARNLDAIEEVIGQSDLPDDVTEPSLRVFRRLAEAEAGIHGTTIDEVHFHEIGAVDSLVDIVGFNVALWRLGIEQIYASPIPLGSGTITTDHGLLPVPVPATLALLKGSDAPTYASPARTEIVTPTGAALLTTLAIFERPAMRIEQVGYGFGRKQMPWANMIRVWIGTRAEVEAESTHQHRHDHGHSHKAHDHHHHHDHEHPHDTE